MGLGEIGSSARTWRAKMACFRAVIVIWLYGYMYICTKILILSEKQHLWTLHSIIN